MYVYLVPNGILKTLTVFFQLVAINTVSTRHLFSPNPNSRSLGRSNLSPTIPASRASTQSIPWSNAAVPAPVEDRWKMAKEDSDGSRDGERSRQDHRELAPIDDPKHPPPSKVLISSISLSHFLCLIACLISCLPHVPPDPAHAWLTSWSRTSRR